MYHFAKSVRLGDPGRRNRETLLSPPRGPAFTLTNRLVAFHVQPFPEQETLLHLERRGLESVVVRRLVATRPDQEANFRGANYGWQKFIGALERVVAGLE